MSESDPSAVDPKRLRDIVPHVWPFALFDRVESFVPQASITAVKHVSANEPWLGMPSGQRTHIVPGVLVLEALLQLGALLVDATSPLRGNILVHVVGCDHVRFRGLVQVGDSLDLSVEVLAHDTNMWTMRGAATQRGIPAVGADFVLATVSSG
ncbi:MAG: beta-hydroxyacyl-ACP dehydratase [Myxococcales bacterium]|jgi:3-hydroxyacyl-[acyl-carrier-protein] dehydratase|nr:beta-hydroxyacyl-ACP dehydratase [Myxococcales bacterium]